jgi:hypothetical protein
VSWQLIRQFFQAVQRSMGRGHIAEAASTITMLFAREPVDHFCALIPRHVLELVMKDPSALSIEVCAS